MIVDQNNCFRTDLNYCFLTDRLCLEAMQFIERGVATPSTLFAANSLIQAVVLHEHVVVGLSAFMGANFGAIDTIKGKLGSGIAPNNIIDPDLPTISTEMASNLYFWLSPVNLTMIQSSQSELSNIEAAADIVRVLSHQQLTLKDDEFEILTGVRHSPTGEAMISNRDVFDTFCMQLQQKQIAVFSPSDLLALRDTAGLIEAGSVLSQFTGCQLYTALQERIFQGHGIQYQGPAKIVKNMENELYDGWILGLQEFTVPPFLGILLSMFKDWDGRFWQRILDLRQRYTALRTAIGTFQIEFKYGSMSQRRRLKKDFDTGWAALLESFDDDQMKQLVKLACNPVEFARAGYERHTDIASVSCLISLWKDMGDISQSCLVHEILAKKCEDVTSIHDWQRVSRLMQSFTTLDGLMGGKG